MLISLNSHDSVPLVEQIINGIKRLADERVLRHGTRLPSIRQFAKDHSVSRFTVVQAYDRLVAAGYLDSRRGSGFYVSRPANQLREESPSCQLDRAIDVLWLVRRSTQEYRSRYMPGCGWLPGSWQDHISVERGLRGIARLGMSNVLEGYGSASGYLPLRQTIQQRLNEKGINAHLEQIVTTHGVVSAMDLIGRYLLKPGDVVLVDDPGYFHTFGHLQTLGAEVVGVPWTPQGPDTEVMEQLVIQHRPRAFLTTTVLHNPTGMTISQACAFRVLRLAEEYDFLIIEDDIYSAFHPDPPTRLATLDQLNRVIYVNGFAKTISPKLRVGYIAAHSDLIQDLLDLKLLTGISSSELTERLVYQVLLDGNYRKHLSHLRDRLQTARELTLINMERYGLRPYAVPDHGIFIWARFDGLEDTATLATAAAKHDITLAPGNIFRPHQEPSPWMRFNIAYCDDQAIFECLARVLKDLTG